MQTELIYEFQINIFTDSGKLIKSINCGEFEFPSEERIREAIENNGADHATVERVYRMGEIPFG